MKTFIEDYVSDHDKAIADAVAADNSRKWQDSVDEEMIYRQIASPEFKLYQEIICCSLT